MVVVGAVAGTCVAMALTRLGVVLLLRRRASGAGQQQQPQPFKLLGPPGRHPPGQGLFVGGSSMGGSYGVQPAGPAALQPAEGMWWRGQAGDSARSMGVLVQPAPLGASAPHAGGYAGRSSARSSEGWVQPAPLLVFAQGPTHRR
jgi:hypothetical protein